MDKQHAEQILAAVLAAFPQTFSLKAFPGEKFRASAEASYVDDNGIPQVYLQRLAELSGWEAFAKGTVEEVIADLGSYDLRDKLRDTLRMHEPFTDFEKFVKAAAEKHTVANMGQPEHMQFQELLQQCEDDAMYDGVMDEFRHWLKDARRCATKVMKAGLPWTLHNEREAFFGKGPFAKQAASQRKARATRAANKAAKAATK